MHHWFEAHQYHTGVGEGMLWIVKCVEDITRRKKFSETAIFFKISFAKRHRYVEPVPHFGPPPGVEGQMWTEVIQNRILGEIECYTTSASELDRAYHACGVGCGVGCGALTVACPRKT